MKKTVFPTYCVVHLIAILYHIKSDFKLGNGLVLDTLCDIGNTAIELEKRGIKVLGVNKVSNINNAGFRIEKNLHSLWISVSSVFMMKKIKRK